MIGIGQKGDDKMTEQDFIRQQIELSEQMTRENTVDLTQVKTVVGVDLAYWEEENVEYAVCCIVVIDYHTSEVLEKVSYVDEVQVPYIPGCLAFREVPIFMEAYRKLKIVPDVVFFDGNGYLHPRHMGLATHAGILINQATVGIAKSYYKIADMDFDMPANIQGAFTDIRINEEVYGRALRTHVNVKPVFLSVGNAIDIETAMELANKLTTKESHVPLPTRLADLMTHQMRKECQSGKKLSTINTAAHANRATVSRLFPL
ncbi:MAG: endonuclease V [Lachnospiraceae bacterium]|nr:endonuclease V [Lachnospiraceae bacterium]